MLKVISLFISILIIILMKWVMAVCRLFIKSICIFAQWSCFLNHWSWLQTIFRWQYSTTIQIPQGLLRPKMIKIHRLYKQSITQNIKNATALCLYHHYFKTMKHMCNIQWTEMWILIKIKVKEKKKIEISVELDWN